MSLTRQPKKKKRRRTHGFRARMARHSGRNILSGRRLKKRRRLAI